MSDLISFLNKDTNKKITMEVNKPFVLVFGRNGAGKTTLSRSFKEKEFVFNTDFIYKNIYIETTTGAKDDTNTKDSFSQLWLGEKIVDLRKEISDLKEKNKNIADQKTALSGNILRIFNDKGIQSVDLGNIKKVIDEIAFEKPADLSDDEIIKKYVSTIKYETDIKSDEELSTKISCYKNEKAIVILNTNLRSNVLLDELFLKKETKEKQKIIEGIKQYNDSLAELKEINNAFSGEDKGKQRNWIKAAIEIHKEKDTCLFCGGENIRDALEKWTKIISSKVNEQKSALAKSVDDIVQSAQNILKNKDQFIELARNTIEGLTLICEYFLKIRERLEKEITIGDDLAFPEFTTDKTTEANNELLKSIQNYLFKPFANEFEALCLLEKDYNSKIKNKDQEVENALSEGAEEIENNINKYLKELDFDKELEIGIERRGAEKKYKFDFANSSTKIATLSDGQKHKLAFAIFLASLQNKDLTDKTIVIDDPVVTLDYRAYHSVRNQIMELTKKPVRRVIVLTCNMSYLYIQLSNTFGNHLMGYIELFRLSGNGATSVNPEIINYDDFSLFKSGLESISSEEEFCQVAKLNIRVYRMFLDLYLRMNGIPSNGNPCEEISLLPNLEESSKERLRELNINIVSGCRDTNSTNEDLYKTFLNTNEFVTILGFPSLLSDKDIGTIEKYNNKHLPKSDFKTDSLLFDIIYRANTILQTDNPKYEYIKNYMNHPRTQLTSSIVGIDFTDLEMKNL